MKAYKVTYSGNDSKFKNFEDIVLAYTEREAVENECIVPNLVGLWCSLFRAIEIAKTGGYSISIHFNQDYKSGFNDYKSIKTFCKGWFDNFVSDGDIKIKIAKPYSYEQKGKWETLKDISTRVEKSLQFPKPELNLCNSSETLLKKATQRLDLSLSQVEKIKQIATTIAQMDFSKTIQAQHIAESIQYSYICDDIGYNAESDLSIMTKSEFIKKLKNKVKSVEFNGKIGTLTISKTPANKYYASVLVDDKEPMPDKPKIKEETTVGIDVGIKSFAVLSNGQVFENMKFLEKNEKRLAVIQKRFSRKQKGSNRRKSYKLKVARQYERITNLRTNYIHQVTSKIIAENQSIVIEDLNIDGMLKNHCLAKSISSVAWGEFFRQLEYKSEFYGRNLVRIGRFEPSSKLCECGTINNELKLSDRIWTCKTCGRINNRDELASRNIKKFGLKRQNLIGLTPAVSGAEDVELSAVAGAKKRQYM